MLRTSAHQRILIALVITISHAIANLLCTRCRQIRKTRTLSRLIAQIPTIINMIAKLLLRHTTTIPAAHLQRTAFPMLCTNHRLLIASVRTVKPSVAQLLLRHTLTEPTSHSLAQRFRIQTGALRPIDDRLNRPMTCAQRTHRQNGVKRAQTFAVAEKPVRIEHTLGRLTNDDTALGLLVAVAVSMRTQVGTDRCGRYGGIGVGRCSFVLMEMMQMAQGFRRFGGCDIAFVRVEA